MIYNFEIYSGDRKKKVFKIGSGVLKITSSRRMDGWMEGGKDVGREINLETGQKPTCTNGFHQRF